MKKKQMMEYFEEVETTQAYEGYYYSVAETLTIVVLGSLCGLKNISQIHQWAASGRTQEFLREEFGISRVPCYYWMLCLLKLVNPESLNECFTNWVEAVISEGSGDTKTLALDGKTVRSTAKMGSYENPLHIVSAQLAEYGLTLGQQSADGKSNEIPAVQQLLRQLKIGGCMIVANALNCQKETAKIIIEGKADYLLSVKDNHPSLKRDIEDYVQDNDLQKTMETITAKEKNRGRIEKRVAFVTDNLAWLPNKDDWAKLSCFGAIHTECETRNGRTSEWHYYISSRCLTAQELLHHVRMEWSVETMHWLLDVHFSEDFCRIEDENVQLNLNMLRKLAINLVKLYKERLAIKRSVSKIMFDCLLNCDSILPVLLQN